MKNEDQPVYPTENVKIKVAPNKWTFPAGLTKREYFAAASLQGLLGRANFTLTAAENVEVAVLLADKLLAELEKKDGRVYLQRNKEP